LFYVFEGIPVCKLLFPQDVVDGLEIEQRIIRDLCIWLYWDDILLWRRTFEGLLFFL